MEIVNPVSAHFFLSDDAQDEISGSGRKKMKCLSCGHKFSGESYDNCPECYSVNTDEVFAGIGGEEDVAEDANMKCLSCEHTFARGVYDHCPECFSLDTEQMTDEKDHKYW